MAEWLVLDMDEGVLRREPTRRAAVDWMRGYSGGQVLWSHRYGPGAYEYTVGFPGEENGFSAFVERTEHARVAGWPVDTEAMYPHADDPYEPRD